PPVAPLRVNHSSPLTPPRSPQRPPPPPSAFLVPHQRPALFFTATWASSHGVLDPYLRPGYSPSLIRSTRRFCARVLYTRRLTMLPGFCAEITFRRSAGECTGVPSTSRMMSGPPLSGPASSP